tara:strand:- start:3202 stop:3345 length:144 start_codon:yes stop_codon:yes gene_type:complete
MTKKILLLFFTFFTMFYLYSNVNQGAKIIDAGAMYEQDFPTNINIIK